ncbi:MAG: helix-turn-helix domain-containing protein [Proteobacteria bacterium]|nr:helix-turn-helix domain-containing protein [Pseudomonadota bacterium]
MVGTSRVSINKLMVSWAEAGFVTVERGRVTLRDLEALEDIAGADS